MRSDTPPQGARHSHERDLERALEVAERGLILRTVVGSVVHGLSNPGTDDRDELGVCIEPPEYLLGFRRFEHFVFRTQPEGVQSGPGALRACANARPDPAAAGGVRSCIRALRPAMRDCKI